MPVEGEVILQFGDGDSETSLKHGAKVAEVAKKGGRYVVRVRDSLAPTRQKFKGAPAYDYDPSVVVEGMLGPSDRPQNISVTTANPAVPGVAHVAGVAEFVYAGTSAEPVAQGDSSTLTVVFYDGTSDMKTAD